MSADVNFLLCEYFNKNGKRVECIYIADAEGPDVADKLRQILKNDDERERLFGAMKAEASGATTSPDVGALALHALIHEVVAERLPIDVASTITSMRVNFRKAVTVSDVVPALDKEFGGHAGCWVRGIFPHLNLGPATIN